MEPINLHEPNEALIEGLRKLLRLAEEGELHSMVCVVTRQGGATGVIRSGSYEIPIMIGQLELLKAQLLGEWMHPSAEIEDDDDE